MAQGSVTATGPAKVGANSAVFNGTTDYVLLGDIDQIDAATELSACAWVYHNSNSTDDYILAGDHPGAGGILFLRDDVGSTSGRTDTYTIFVQKSDESTFSKIEGASNTGLTNTWNHVCFTFIASNANGLRLYISGIEDANSPISTALIDEVVIWNKAISSSEIELLYQRQSLNFTELRADWTPHWNNIVGYWKMDGNWQDSSGNGNHGTANGDATFDIEAKVGSQSGAFDGTGDYIELPNIDAIEGVNNITVSGWINLQDSSCDFERIFHTEEGVQIWCAGAASGNQGKLMVAVRNFASALVYPVSSNEIPLNI